MDTIQPIAWRCIWRKGGKSAWEQYHDETDPLPEKWDCAPNDVIALYDQATVDALRKDAERYRWLRDKGSSAEITRVMAEYSIKWDVLIDAAMNGANKQ